MTSVRERTPVADRPCVDYLGQSAGFPLNRLAVPRRVAFWLVAYVFGITILGTSLPAPLYTLWQRQWHFNSGVVTLVFAVYAIAGWPFCWWPGAPRTRSGASRCWPRRCRSG